MEAASLVFSVTQTLFAALQCKKVKEVCSLLGYESELHRLQDTVSTIKSVLLDAEAKDVLNHQQLSYVMKLKSVVYDADDLLDEFTALAEQEQHLLQGGKFSRKVKLWLSCFGKLNVFRKMSKNVKKIRKELDAIASDASRFSFKVDYEPIRRRREDTYSYVHEKNVIGREVETKEIIDMLLAPDAGIVYGDLSVLAIVGIGGLGKTTLAQHVYEHDKIKKAFPLRLWTCVSDQDQDQLLLQPILAKILESATGKKKDGFGIELIQRQVRELLQGKKYLLVLDDVWSENRNEWLKLENLLMGGARGSRIIVTTRSEKTAEAVGNTTPYKLQGLSEENSWCLFERVAFGGKEELKHHDELVKIGKEILKKCSNVPLSIRVIASLLYGQEKKNWLEFQQSGLAEMIKGDKTLMPILKFSYHHLHPAMKSCFSYCALFPKGSIIQKEELISLWIAQGYIEPLREGQLIDDAAEDYFMILLWRCFFHDIEKNEIGEIVHCKMHDLMHNMAQEVAGKDICLMDHTTGCPGKNVRHVSHVSCINDVDDQFFNETKIRTYLHHIKVRDISAASAKWTRLRVLKLMCVGKRLPDCIGSLLHLRYIDLSYNYYLEKLPESITQLHYLQSLILKGCKRLKELPKGLSKLINLRLLDTIGCEFSCMPAGMYKLTRLTRLTRFVVSDISSKSDLCGSGLEDLRALKDLKGDLSIMFGMNFRFVKEESRSEGYFSNKKYLTSLAILLDWHRPYRGAVDGHNELLQDLQPHGNLKELLLEGYADARMPRWMVAEKLETTLPNLVNICLHGCFELQQLPSFSKLRHLKSLELLFLSSLEYMEDTLRPTEEPFFPSLEKLELQELAALKGWWKEFSRVMDETFQTNEWMSFPRLSKLTIRGCPKLKYMPFCPMLETLSLLQFNEKLRIMIADREEELDCYAGNQGHMGLLRSVELDNIRCLVSLLPVRALQSLKEMKICNDEQIESLSEVGEQVLCSCLSSLRCLQLSYLPKLKYLAIRGGLEHLTSLEFLKLHHLPNLSFTESLEEDMPWICLRQNLLHLELWHLPGVVKLPRGMQYLTSLQFLYIDSINLEALPEWIGHLTSLQSLHILDHERFRSLPESMGQLISLTHLTIWRCSKHLCQRCRLNGEDWPNIRHIPCIDIRDW